MAAVVWKLRIADCSDGILAVMREWVDQWTAFSLG